jgi:glycosyltransferase involved in cell wall biosynthesis
LSKGGLELNTMRQAERMQKRGYRVLVLCLHDSPLHHLCRGANVPVVCISRPWKYADIPSALRVIRILREHGCRQVVFSLNHDLSLAGRIKRRMPSLSIVYWQQMGLGVNKRDILHTRRYQSIDAWIAPLQSLRNEVLQRTRVPTERVHVIPLAVDSAHLGESIERGAARAQFGLPEAGFSIGIIGRLDPAKGQLLAIQSMPCIREALGDVHLVLVGEASVGMESHAQEIQREIHNLGLTDAVHVHPFLHKPGVFFDAVDLFLMATRSETFGMVTVEALMRGCPVAGTNSGGTPEILEQGAWGRLFEPGSQPEICRVVQEAFVHRDHDRERAQLFASLAAERYGVEQTCAAFERVLDECAKHQRG